MAEPPVLNVDALRTALGRALDAVEAQFGGEAVLVNDYYWNLPVESAFYMTQEPEPESLTVGQLSDDLASMTSPAEPEALSTWHDLGHLIGLLRALEMEFRP
jgi:hypothetical protein